MSTHFRKMVPKGRINTLPFGLSIMLLALLFAVPAAWSETVLVELFTSEGCSSCPPADRLLSRLNGQELGGVSVVCLSEHVDYWNYLGWQDPFSKRQFSQRQAWYASRLETNGCYTPQMVIDGLYEGNGADADFAARAIRNSAQSHKSELSILRASFAHGTLKYSVAYKPRVRVKGEGRFYVALCQDDLVSVVKSGENAGRLLKHSAVVRDLRMLESCSLGGVWKRDFALTLDKNPGEMKLIVFIQDQDGRVVAVSSKTALEVRGY